MVLSTLKPPPPSFTRLPPSPPALHPTRWRRSNPGTRTPRIPQSGARCGFPVRPETSTVEVPVRPSSVAHRLERLASEFRALPEPIERVKRLLHHATLLPHLSDSGRVEENRVAGCATQVWVEVAAACDRPVRLRFRADSDSEITRGFCSCLVWLLDGAAPEEVMAVTAEDLADMNVGLSGRARSRVNSWHNILIGMQERTKVLVESADSTHSSQALGSLVSYTQ